MPFETTRQKVARITRENHTRTDLAKFKEKKMANHKTGAQRYNDKMDEIFARSKELNMKYHGKDSFGSSNTPSEARKRALQRGIKGRSHYSNRQYKHE